jgi:uncharacterized membrane protein YkvA (DUF1232 family)
VELLLYILAGIVAAVLLAAIGVWILWRRVTREERRLIKRVTALPLLSKLRLTRRLVTDGRMPLLVRLMLPLLVLYLAMPIDIIPDFIPVIGLFDDVFLLVVGVYLLLRLTPRSLIESHIEMLERLHAEQRTMEASGP